MRRRLAFVLALASVLGMGVAPVAAIDPIPGSPLPNEPAATLLSDRATEAVGFDLDVDGVDELVAVTATDETTSHAQLQATWVDEDGVSAQSEAVAVRRSPSPQERAQDRGLSPLDRENLVALRGGEPARFLVARRGGSPVLLLATVGTRGATQDLPCCLTVWEVRSRARGEVELNLVGAAERPAASLTVADLDGDGTDELFANVGPLPGLEGSDKEFGVWQWAGDRFQTRAIRLDGVLDFCCSVLPQAGDTDGLPGEEVLLVGPTPGQEGLSTILRLSLRGGEPRFEASPTDFLMTAHPLSLERGPRVLVGTAASLQVWSWPRDELPVVEVERAGGWNVATVFGRGAESRIVSVSSLYPVDSVRVLPGEFGSETAPADFGRDTRAGAFANAAAMEFQGVISPYSGLLNLPGPDDRIAYAFAGKWVTPDADPEVLATSETMALLPDIAPVAAIGPEGAWTALLGSFDIFLPPSTTDSADLQQGHEPASLTLARTETILEPEGNMGRLEPTWYGVARVPNRETAFLVGSEPVDAEVAAPTGSAVTVRLGEASGSAQPTNGVFRVIGPATSQPEGHTLPLAMWVITPSGHAYSGVWTVEVHRQPPDVDIVDDEAIINLSPSLSGVTLPGSTVTINGEPVPVADDGSFSAPVEVGLAPTEVRIVVIDPVGNRTEHVVTRVWPLDYRRLPFVPIMVVVTILAGLALYLRRPDAGPRPGATDDGATIEEIG
jgi:hypothetical protein